MWPLPIIDNALRNVCIMCVLQWFFFSSLHLLLLAEATAAPIKRDTRTGEKKTNVSSKSDVVLVISTGNLFGLVWSIDLATSYISDARQKWWCFLHVFFSVIFALSLSFPLTLFLLFSFSMQFFLSLVRAIFPWIHCARQKKVDSLLH